jgi:UDP-N-acetylglucosamine diphosphorylase/glucosamine-1-phosphate N-acetyltransferase
MTLCPFEDADVAHLLPLLHTRAAFDLRVGARTLLAAQRAAFPEASGLALHTRPHLAAVTAEEHPGVPVRTLPGGGVLFVNARWRPRPGPALDAVRAAVGTRQARAFVQGETLVAFWTPGSPLDRVPLDRFQGDVLGRETAEGVPEEAVDGVDLVSRLWHVVDDVEGRVAEDVADLGGLGTRDGADVRDGARLVGAEAIHLAPGAVVRPGAVLSAEDGPVRLEAGAVVEEHALVRGPCWLGPGAVVKAGGRVDGSALGPQAKVGGEVHASVVVGLSNKAHDGYLGNSYLGRWCNLGAGTDTSNLRNDYGEVTLWDAVANDFLPTGRQFLGLVMADHAKCAIGTRFNTGAVVGVACNWYGARFPPRRLPAFSWGGDDGLETYRLDRALRVAEAVMARRNRPLTEAGRALLAAVFEATAAARARLVGGA